MNEEILKNIILENLDTSKKVDKDTDLITIGLDSLIFAKLVAALEDQFNIEIPVSVMVPEKMNTIYKIQQVISKLYEAKSV